MYGSNAAVSKDKITGQYKVAREYSLLTLCTPLLSFIGIVEKKDVYETASTLSEAIRKADTIEPHGMQHNHAVK